MQALHSHDSQKDNDEPILVVDDDAVTRNYLTMLLQRWGYAALAVHDLPSARKALSEASFSMALIDLTYPDDDATGYDLVDLIRVEQPDCAVMIITSDRKAETAVEGIRLRVDDYFLKPVKAEDLLSAVRHHAGGHGNAGQGTSDVVDFSALTRREKTVLSMFHKGCTYKETARILGCEVSTVQTHAKNIYRKLGVHSRAEAAHEAIRLNLIQP